MSLFHLKRFLWPIPSLSESIFDTEYNNVYEIQFVEDTTHEMKKWLLVKNGVTIGYMEEI